MPKMNEIAEIRSGYLFRCRLENDPEGNIKVIQLKDVGRDRLSIEDCITIKKEFVGDVPFIEQGDILFKAKSSRHESAVFDLKLEDAIPTNNLFVIRPKKDVVNSKFISSYINSKHAQQYFEKVAGGSRIPVVNMKSLGELKIPIPPIEVQKKVVELIELYQEEEELVDRIKGKRRELIGSVFDGLLKGKLEVNK